MFKYDTLKLCGEKDKRRGYNQSTASGKPFWVLDPRPEDIRIQDIAAQLSRVCRFGGALREGFEVYSVAQHSCLVSIHVPYEYALEGLLHDAAEAYTWDMIKPQKHAMPEACAIQDNIERVIREKYGLPKSKSPEVKRADFEAACTERRDIMPPDATVDWGLHIRDIYDNAWEHTISPWLPSKAARMFLWRYYEIINDGAPKKTSALEESI